MFINKLIEEERIEASRRTPPRVKADGGAEAAADAGVRPAAAKRYSNRL